MAGYLINLMGNCCELFIILFFLKDNYKLRVKKKIAIPLIGLILLYQFVTNNLFLGESALVILTCSLFIFLIMLLYDMKMWQRVIYTILIYVVIGFSEVIIVTALSIGFDIDVSYIQSNKFVFAIGTLSSKFLAYAFILFSKVKRFAVKNESFKISYVSVFILPIASILIMLVFLRSCFQIDDTGFFILSLITSIVLISANIAIFYIIDKQNDLIKTKEKLFFTETHINSQIAHYEELYRH